ncbi:MAG: hypothetical protein ACRELY_28690, partial [Polyangiaceae bacterium]
HRPRRGGRVSNMDDKKIDDALGAWPEIGGRADDTASAKTMTKIRANFPPKSKLSITDDALFAAPLPSTAEEWEEEKAAAEEKSSQIDVPMARASSIPPPSSGVSRSERNEIAAAEDAPRKVEAGMGQVERQRERTSFKDLAKLAATPPPSSVKPSSAKIPIPAPPSSMDASGDSGVVDLQAAALSDPLGAERAKSTPLASGSLFDEEGPQSGQSAPPPSLSGELRASGPLSAVQSVPQQIDPYAPASVRPSAPPSSRLESTLASAGPHSAVAALRAEEGAQQKVEEKKSSPVLAILGGLVAVSAIAAGALFYVKTHHAAAPVAAAQPIAQAADATQPTQATPDQTTANDTTPQLLAQGTAQNDTQKTAPAMVSKSGRPVAHASKPVSAKAGSGNGALADAMEKDTSSTPPAPPPAEAKANDTPPPSGSSADLQNAMKTAVGPSDSSGGDTKATPSGPKFAPGSVPQRPSQGALAGAIGIVMPGARACLGPDDGVSYATIVFQSAGDTQKVTLSGFAANKPAGACITTALKKANVGPFAETTYSAKVTVRP